MGDIKKLDDEDKNNEPLKKIKPLYILPEENLAYEALVPAFTFAENVSCMVGFFSSSVLTEIAPGLATYINSSNKPLRLLMSPFLSKEDQDALTKGLLPIENHVINLFENFFVTEDYIKKHTLECVSFLLQKKRIEIKIVYMKNALFHPKVWIFENDDKVMAIHGSSNMTTAGIRNNFEQITVSKSWVDQTQNEIANSLKNRFEVLWKDQEKFCKVVDLPDAISKKLVQTFPTSKTPEEGDYFLLFKKVMEQELSSYIEDIDEGVLDNFPQDQNFEPPSWLNFSHGDFDHQKKAIEAWCREDNNGILQMATGSGKTLTALGCAYELFKKKKPLLIVVAAPYVPLIQQWCIEAQIFNLKPINITLESSRKNKTKILEKISRRLKFGNSEVELVVISHDELSKAAFFDAISKVKCTKLLIADEMHNLSSDSFRGETIRSFENIIGLSATPILQYDEEKTKELIERFRGIVFTFDLKEAIGKCLVEYDYYVHKVILKEEEVERWLEITSEIQRNSWRLVNQKKDSHIDNLLRKRRLILETAADKDKRLSMLLDKENLHELKHTLIYLSDKQPEQMERINQMLLEKGIKFHQITDEETGNRKRLQILMEEFKSGEIQVITAKRVLDEGVNIPEISKAFILASTTVERQWIQRRGRLLRKCPEIGKTHSVIHDFLVVPFKNMDQNYDDNLKKILETEYQRIYNFASLSRNAGLTGGALSTIGELIQLLYF